MAQGIEEIVRHLRFIHFSLVSLCFVVIYVAFSDRNNMLDRAQSELEIVLELRNNLSSVETLSELLKPYHKSEGHLALSAHISCCPELVVDGQELPTFGVRWMFAADPGIPVYAIDFASLAEYAQPERHASSAELMAIVSDTTGMRERARYAVGSSLDTLAEVEKRFDHMAGLTFGSPVPLQVDEPYLVFYSGGDMSLAMQDVLKVLEEGGKTLELDVTYVDQIDAALPVGQFQTQWLPYDLGEDAEFEYVGSKPVSFHLSAAIEGLAPGLTMDVVSRIKKWNIVHVSGRRVLRDLMGLDESTRLYPKFSTQFATLSLLSAGLEGAPIEELETQLIEYADDAQPRVEVLGLQVRKGNISLFGGLGMLVIQLYFWLHFSTFTRTVRQFGTVPPVFPWIALYPSWPPRVTFVLSVSVLPLAVVGLLASIWPGENTVMTGAVVASASIVLIVMTLRSYWNFLAREESGADHDFG